MTFLVVALLGGWVVWQRTQAGNSYAGAGDNVVGDFFGMNTELKPLRYFKPAEFGDWWPLMSTELLIKLDNFRHVLGVPVTISPAAGAIGRNGGLSTSQHNADLWGEVRAVDIMLEGVSLERAYEVAKQVGFSGIGLYPDWKPSQGVHLDVRQSPLALWSGIMESGKQVYKSINQAFA